MYHHTFCRINEASDDILLEKIWPLVEIELFDHNVTPLPALSKEEKVFICKIYAIGYEAGYNYWINEFNDLKRHYGIEEDKEDD